ncbi:MAG: twin-arginine translocase TatA/TatE family subunit [Calditrichaeota bacterium]|nr:MAG: twin-arginine translocase TatA/TatE family subunit [Calditrichota bacterium]MBL1206926.1 twin-arginine translocase TatA/TatE family subunit [Calditrichota bacterium]NOG46753.1 twin-arginine translocase TatA/TatE family subunit [Calditrichota bacterium]
MFGIGTTELLVILFIILLVFGSKKLPELAKGLGKGINEFKRASQDIQSELDINAPLKEKNEKSAKKEDETPKSE